MRVLVAILFTLPHGLDAACSSQTPCKMPNIDYIGMGYDIVHGNPHCGTDCLANGIDPGWQDTNPVLALIYDNTTTGDGRFYVPQGFHILETPACTMSSNTLSIHSTQAYQSALSVDAQVKGGGLSFSFSASTDYQTTTQQLSDYAKTQYQTTARCGVYVVNVLADYTLNLTAEFRRGVVELPAGYDRENYLEFVENFGSHFVSRVMMGAKYTYHMEFDTEDVQTMTSTGVDVAAGVSVNMIFAHAGVSTNVSWHRSDQQAMSQFHSTQWQIILGNAPPSPFVCTAAPCSPDQMDMSTWQALLLTDSADLAPLGYELQSLETLLTKEYFPADADILQKAENFYNFLANDYCGAVKGCAPPNPYGYWTKQPSVLVPVVAAAGVSFGSGAFFVIGGSVSSGVSTSLVQAFTSEDTGIGWSVLKQEMPTARHNASTSSDLDGAIYVFGGQHVTSSNTSRAVASVERFDVRTMAWATQRDMPWARFSHASVSLANGEIWLLGGNINGKPTARADAYRSDSDAWFSKPNMTAAREGLCAGVINGVVYAVGGYDGQSFLTSCEAFANTTWAKCPPMNYGRSGASCGVVENGLVVVGGRNVAGILDLVEIFTEDGWIVRSSSLNPVWLGTAAPLLDFSEQNTKLFVAGGTSLLPTGPEGTELTHYPNANGNSPTLSRDNRMIYFASSDSLNAVDVTTGELMWSFVVSGVLECKAGPVLSPAEDQIYFGDDDGFLYAVNTTTGQGAKILQASGRLFDSPVLSNDGGTLYIGSFDYCAYAFDVNVGRLKWKYSTKGKIYANLVLSSDNSVVYVASEDASLYALFAATGKVKWITQPFSSIYAPPALSPDGNVLYVMGSCLYAVDAGSGSVKWSFTGMTDGDSAPVVSASGMIYFGSWDFSVYALTPSGNLAWSFKTGDQVKGWPTLSLDQSLVFIGSQDANFYALDAITGLQRWKFPVGTASRPRLSNDGAVVYFGSNVGLVYAVWTRGPFVALDASSNFYAEV